MTTQRQKILMCSPEFYGVEYIINPWMEGQLGNTDAAIAREHWHGLRDALATEADIELVPPVKGVPDLVFTANAAFVRGDLAVVSHFSALERRGEEPIFRAWFEQNGYRVAPWPDDVYFEGAGDALLDRERPLLWCGYGFRSDLAASALLEKTYDIPTVPLKLVNPSFYHLDTCLCPLTGGYVMYYPPAFDEPSQAKIAAIVPPEKRIVVTEADAMLFACNAVDLNGRIFMNEASDDLQNKLKAIGFATTITPLGEFLRAGGTAKMPDAQADRAVTFPRRIILFALALLIPAILLCMFPEWDLAASAFFYDAPHGGFYLADQIPLVALHEIATKGAWVLGLILLVLTVATGLRRQPLHGQPMKNWLFLLITLIVGPVLVANMGLKDHWGRARPREIIEFGGMAHFSAALSPEPVLHKNGSFVNGDASFGFFLPNFAYLFRRPDEAQKSRRIFWGGMLLGRFWGYPNRHGRPFFVRYPVCRSDHHTDQYPFTYSHVWL